MKTCELCGERIHPGQPCYAEIRDLWREEDIDRFMETKNGQLYRFNTAAGEILRLQYFLQK